MNLGQNEFRRLNRSSYVDSKPADSQGSDLDHSTAMSEILGRIVGAIEQPEAFHPANEVQWHSVLEAVRHHRVSPFSATPVLRDLVKAVLGKPASLHESVSESMIEFVAETLFADADSRSRLHRMWDHLRLVLESEHH